MTHLGILAAAAGAWTILATVVALPLGRFMKKNDPEPDDTQWIPYLPPVPPVDAAWLASQPVDVWLTDELSDRLFDELIAIEGLDQ